jgi:hypothetical protein
MLFIQEFILNHPNKSALIVSHNIDLALDFADRIIILTKNYEDASSTSTIQQEFILDKDIVAWNTVPELKKRIKKEIELLLNNEASHFVKLLSRIKKLEIPAEKYAILKEKLIDWEIFKEENKLTPEKLNNPQLRTEAENEAIRKNKELITSLCYKDIKVEPAEKEIIDHLIAQFFDTFVPSYAPIINRVIGQIKDKTFAGKVQKLVDNGGKKDRKSDTGPKRSFFKIITTPFRLLFWIILSIVPWINSLFEAIVEFIRTKIFRISSAESNGKTGPFGKLVKVFNDWLRRRRRTCLNRYLVH